MKTIDHINHITHINNFRSKKTRLSRRTAINLRDIGNEQTPCGTDTAVPRYQNYEEGRYC